MPQFNLDSFNDNFSEYIQDNNLDREEIEAGLNLCQDTMPLPPRAEDDAVSKEYEHLIHGLVLGSPWSKGGLRHLMLKMLSDWHSKNRKE